MRWDRELVGGCSFLTTTKQDNYHAIKSERKRAKDIVGRKVSKMRQLTHFQLKSDGRRNSSIQLQTIMSISARYFVTIAMALTAQPWV